MIRPTAVGGQITIWHVLHQYAWTTNQLVTKYLEYDSTINGLDGNSFSCFFRLSAKTVLITFDAPVTNTAL